jgi:hypothetical protein
MSRFRWECDRIGYGYDRMLREDCEVRIRDREKDDRIVYTTSLPQVTYEESRVQSARVLDLFLLTQLENQP